MSSNDECLKCKKSSLDRNCGRSSKSFCFCSINLYKFPICFIYLYSDLRKSRLCKKYFFLLVIKRLQRSLAAEIELPRCEIGCYLKPIRRTLGLRMRG